MSVVKELVTLWGFDIDQKPIKELNAGLNTIKATLAGIGLAVGAAAGAVGYLLNEAGQTEQTKIAFETMLGSAEAAQTQLEELRAFALKTPFDLKGLSESTKKLLAYGFASEEIIPTLNNLGNISAGVGTEKLPFLILALGQVRAAGKLTGAELRQFTENGVPLLLELSKTMGKPVKEIQKMVSDGKIGFNDVQTALASLSGEGGRFFNLMEKQSKSFLGMIANMTDYFQILASDIGTELIPLAKELVGEFLEWARVNREVIKANILEFVKNLTDMMFGLVNIIKALYYAINPVAQALGGWNSMLNLIMKSFQALMSVGILYGIGLLSKALFGLAMGWKTMGLAAMWAQIKIMAIPLAIGAIVVAIALIAEDILAFTQGRDSVFGRMVSGLDTAFASIKSKFGFFGELGQHMITTILTPIRMIVNGFRLIGLAIDAVKGKKSLGEVMSGMGGLIGNTLGFGDARNGFSGALGVMSNAGAASAQVMDNNTPMVGLGGGINEAAKPLNQAMTGKGGMVNEVKIDVHGMSPEAQLEMTKGAFADQLNNIMRETMRDAEPMVER